MKVILTVSVLSALLGLSSAMAFAHGDQARIGELALHRVERLVILNKLASGYEKQFAGLTVADLDQPQPTDPAFKIALSQYAPANGNAKSVEIFTDHDGKEISHNEVAGNEPSNPPAWPDKDPLTLAELSLHWVEAHANDADIAPFFKLMSSLSIKLGKDSSGNPSAIVDIHHATDEENDPTLRITLMLNGMFMGYQILP